ncbi:MAG: hypothetical protein DWQ06_12560 [Calditrichaeota bacterium]|nr:MAG: hypothetical protein DWQ06_12560 [Calditrichota bacterium]
MTSNSPNSKPKFLSIENLPIVSINACLILTILVIVVGANDPTIAKPIVFKSLSLLSASLIFITCFFKGEVVLPNQKVQIALGCLVLCVFYSFFKSEHSFFAKEGIELFFAQVLIFYSGIFVAQNNLNSILKTLAFLVCLTVFLGVLFATGITGIYLANSKDFFISTFGNPNYFAGFLVLALPLLFLFLEKNVKGKRIKHFAIFAICCAVLGLILTKSKGAFFALGIQVLLYFLLAYFSNFKKHILLTLFFLCVISAPLFLKFSPETEIQTFESRKIIWNSSLNSIQDTPFFGKGYGTFQIFFPKFRSPDYWLKKSEDVVLHAHNEFLEIISEIGLIGFVFWSCLILLILFGGFSQDKNKSGLLLTLVIIGGLANAVFNVSLRTIPNILLFYLSLGILHGSQTDLMRIKINPNSYFLRLGIPALILIFASIKIFSSLNTDSSKITSDLFLQKSYFIPIQNSSAVKVDFLEKSIKNNPFNLKAIYELGFTNLKIKNYVGALDAFEKLELISPNYPKVQLLKGTCYIDLKLPEKAEISTRNALKQKSGFWEYLQMIQVFSYENKNGKIINTLPKATKTTIEELYLQIKNGEKQNRQISNQLENYLESEINLVDQDLLEKQILLNHLLFLREKIPQFRFKNIRVLEFLEKNKL